jgi:hypothetical protein
MMTGRNSAEMRILRPEKGGNPVRKRHSRDGRNDRNNEPRRVGLQRESQTMTGRNSTQMRILRPAKGVNPVRRRQSRDGRNEKNNESRRVRRQRESRTITGRKRTQMRILRPAKGVNPVRRRQSRDGRNQKNNESRRVRLQRERQTIIERCNERNIPRPELLLKKEGKWMKVSSSNKKHDSRFAKVVNRIRTPHDRGHLHKRRRTTKSSRYLKEYIAAT